MCEGDEMTELMIPDPTREAAAELAQELEMSLSELYTAALEAFLAKYKEEKITEALNRVYKTESSALDPQIISIQAKTLGEESW